MLTPGVTRHLRSSLGPLGAEALSTGLAAAVVAVVANDGDGELIANGTHPITAWTTTASHGDQDVFEVTPGGVVVHKTGAFLCSMRASSDSSGHQYFGVLTGAAWNQGAGAVVDPTTGASPRTFGFLYVEDGATLGADITNPNDDPMVMYVDFALLVP